MACYRMRLVEQLVEEDSGDFTVEADTPELAAAILLRAHDAAREDCRDLVVLPDGLAETRSVCRWARRIEPKDVIDNRVFCIRLDNAGEERGGEIEPDFEPSPTGTDEQDSAGMSGADVQP